jgi:hypothetical protein
MSHHREQAVEYQQQTPPAVCSDHDRSAAHIRVKLTRF